jgi:hypothetical protein
MGGANLGCPLAEEEAAAEAEEESMISTLTVSLGPLP